MVTLVNQSLVLTFLKTPWPTLEIPTMGWLTHAWDQCRWHWPRLAVNKWDDQLLTDQFVNGLFSFVKTPCLSSQMAEARGVPRGSYDDPVHDVISMTKSVPSTPLTRGPPCPKSQTGTRNLHQSGFTLAGRDIHTEIWTEQTVITANRATLWVISSTATRSRSKEITHLTLASFSRSSGWWPHTTPLHSADCGTPWWPIEHHVLIVNKGTQTIYIQQHFQLSSKASGNLVWNGKNACMISELNVLAASQNLSDYKHS